MENIRTIHGRMAAKYRAKSRKTYFHFMLYLPVFLSFQKILASCHWSFAKKKMGFGLKPRTKTCHFLKNQIIFKPCSSFLSITLFPKKLVATLMCLKLRNFKGDVEQLIVLILTTLRLWSVMTVMCSTKWALISWLNCKNQSFFQHLKLSTIVWNCLYHPLIGISPIRSLVV